MNASVGFQISAVSAAVPHMCFYTACTQSSLKLSIPHVCSWLPAEDSVLWVEYLNAWQTL